MMQRRLTAILSADVAGYTGLMEVDEAGTLERLKVNRDRIFDPLVAAQGGRVVKLMGDGNVASIFLDRARTSAFYAVGMILSEV